MVGINGHHSGHRAWQLALALAGLLAASAALAGSTVQEPEAEPGPDAPRCIAGACLGDLRMRFADFGASDEVGRVARPPRPPRRPLQDAHDADDADVTWRIIDRVDEETLAPHTAATIATTTCYSPGASQRIDIPLVHGASEADYFDLLESYRVQFGAGRPRVAGLEHETWWRWSWPQAGTGLRLIRETDGTIVAVLFSTALADQDDACARHARRREHVRQGLLPM